ncbi:hypothetical protein [Oerskovia enterophila]|nr:hypothetical protein [Oerskovia enterophila]
MPALTGLVAVGLLFGATPAASATAQTPPSTALTAAAEDDPIIQPMDAASCQWAPGAAGNTHCFSVYGKPAKGPFIYKVIDEFMGLNAGNICSATAEIKYHPAWATGTYTRTIPNAGCAGSAMQLSWFPNENMKVGSDICGRQKNNKTNQAYTAWICHKIGAA